jgi:hypothetical protein
MCLNLSISICSTLESYHSQALFMSISIFQKCLRIFLIISFVSSSFEISAITGKDPVSSSEILYILSSFLPTKAIFAHLEYKSLAVADQIQDDAQVMTTILSLISIYIQD